MATLQSRSFFSLPRTGRAETAGRKALVASSSSANGAAAAAPSTQIPSATSHVSLFLTNLRLLDLDLLSDWPDINAYTFSTKDAGQGQKKRIQCVEWALYQLFALWDPDETRNKLQPYFPPLDQVQSINLRAGLLRALENLKRNGVLGRDAIVRKTMLDECKGERVEEVLAVFSSAVLKKLVAEDQLNSGVRRSPALTLALENRGYSGERTQLNALVLAHKVSLTEILRQKSASREKFNDFSELLHLKQRSIARRREQVRALVQKSGAGGSSHEAKLDVRRMVRNNWSGSERWMETLLYGGVSGQDALIAAPFDRVWRRVQSGRLAELEDRSGGLLEQLNIRVRVQRERLERWESFREEMFGNDAEEPTGTSQNPLEKRRGVDLGFRAHEDLHLSRLSPRKLPSKKTAKLTGEYAGLVDGLKAELSRINKGSSKPLTAMLPPRRNESNNRSAEHLQLAPPEDDPISELSELEEELVKPPVVHQRKKSEPTKQCQRLEPLNQRTKALDIKMPNADGPLPQPVLTKRSSIVESLEASKPLRPTRGAPPQLQLQSPPISPLGSPVRTPSPTRSPRRCALQALRHEPQAPEQPQSPTKELADQILASMNDASPSPVKKPRHTLSLAERTRLSMAMGFQAAKLDEFDEHDFESLPIRRTNTVSSHKNGNANGHHDAGSKDEDEDGLVARTRKSMAGFEAARQKAQLDRRRSQRKSKHAPNVSVSRKGMNSDFAVLEEGESTLLLTEELMAAEQEDGEAIFRSRPKIKTSPAPSPTKEWDSVGAEN